MTFGTTDIVFLIVMGVLAVAAAGTFAGILRYLFDHGLANPDDAAIPDLRRYYRQYMHHTRQHSGRIGPLLWAHAGAAGLFILAGMLYVLFRVFWSAG